MHRLSNKYFSSVLENFKPRFVRHENILSRPSYLTISPLLFSGWFILMLPIYG